MTALLLRSMLLVLVAGSAAAQVVTVPPDLAPGAGYRLVLRP